MSEGDQDCLLAYLWGLGSAPVLNDLSNNNVLSTSYDFVQTMNSPYGTATKTSKSFFTKEFELEAMPLTYAHLAVSPREIVEADAIDWNTGTAALVIKTNQGKEETVYVDEGKIIYESIRKHSQYEKIMRFLRESELLRYSGNETIELVFVQKDNEGKKIINAGPTDALQSIFSFSGNPTAAAGNIPFLCKSLEKKKRKYYEIKIEDKVMNALQRQKDLLECLRKDKNKHNFLPYMEDFLVMDWFSILETHLFRINCSNYGRWDVFRFQKYRPAGMEGLRMEDIMHGIFRYKALESDEEETKEVESDREEMESREWWHMWLDSYKKELQINEEKKEEYKDIRDEIIHKKYDILRKRERKRPPTEWLMKNKLVTCD